MRIEDLPPFRWYRKQLAAMGVTTYAGMQEARLDFYRELSQLLAQYASLAEALELLSLGDGEMSSLIPPLTNPKVTVFEVLKRWVAQLVIAIIILLQGPLAFFVLFLGLRDNERTIRIIARRALADHERGIPLSEALDRYGVLAAGERELLAAGERSGQLAKALSTLARMQHFQHERRGTSLRLVPPATVGLIAMGVALFISIMVIPKMEDIFRQIGSEPPSVFFYVSGRMSDLFFSPFAPLISIPLGVGYILFLLWFFRRLIESSAFGALLAATIMSLPIYSFLLTNVFLVSLLLEIPHWITILISVLFVLLTFARIGTFLPRILLNADRLFSRLLSYVPFFNHEAKFAQQATWLSCVGFQLEGGVPAQEALRIAGRGVGWRRASERVAARVEAGIPLGQCCAQMPFPHSIRWRLEMMDMRDEPSRLLYDLADDSAIAASEQLDQFQSLVGLLSMLFLGIAIGALVYAIYSALFAIPAAVMGLPQ
jgi:type II secretory pathway component PulF